MMRSIGAALAVTATAIGSARAQTTPHADRWAAYRFLIGSWVGEGSGKPGQGSGRFALAPDLQSAVLVRRNVADYPAEKDRAAVHHEDLMLIYHGEAGKPDRAVYFDSESHVIEYVVAASGGGLVFTSEAKPGTPSYRLAYAPAAAGAVTVQFQMAPPGSPPAFRTYLTGTVRRVGAHASPP